MSIELSYDFTAAPAPSAPTVVLIGSLGSDRSMWDPQIGALAAVADVIAVDLRGHGDSPVPPGPYSVGDLAADVLAVLDARSIDSAHVVGLSIGGAIAQWLAVHRPLRVRSLTLLCTSARFGEPQAWRDRAEAARADGTESLADAVTSRWFTSALAVRDPDLLARHRRMIADTPDEGYASCCEALAGWDNRADLGRITARTLIVAGEQDPATPPAEARILADGIARSTMHVLSPAAHLANVEQAGEVSRLILDHISPRIDDDAYESGRRAAHEAGMRVRRSVLGDAHVDRSIERTTEFTAPFQDFITRTAWGDVWARAGLDHRTRRLLTLAILTAVGNRHELDMHIRAALRAGLSADELSEVFLHTAVYAGVPNSNAAFVMADAALAESKEAEST
ncbi:MAG: bifunctional 3-oxoadipate enol-lactonase/4-carboxymuconolactone decarboxylase PcaDC [Rhodococcus sp. (in: high G+C Gram-positive bacteria)]|uniref:bifunctional 3-oxoadipate enol-lactonase/4-carboxymuconolactone decarboxylase PcaDC n=1 Tax=Rhodococcoides yunnanense TaxID=278209 RepID=UPI0022B0F635|nr:3-oxoadipate enol-lactonase [Rhodococcus yunnanensis]MCZ4275028.1 3-oxoadipate enol-lactonase [Rhodococcus yunnanensis]